jgi:hypothetical protein
VLHEIDDIARATMSSITLATMLKLLDEPGGAGEGQPAPPGSRARAAGARSRG